MNQTLTVKRIDMQSDRVCLYGDDPNYKVIATVEQGKRVSVGDTVTFEPSGVNFGWMVE